MSQIAIIGDEEQFYVLRVILTDAQEDLLARAIGWAEKSNASLTMKCLMDYKFITGIIEVLNEVVPDDK